MTVVVNKEVKDRQYAPEVLITDKLIGVVSLILTKIKKYEEIGRIDKAFEIVKYLSSIYLILKYWHYSGLAYKDLPKCIETTLECSLGELKEKLKILPRDLWLDVSTLLAQLGYQPQGVDDLQIIGTDKDNTLIDFQVLN